VGPTFAGDVQFDPQTIIQRRLVDEAADRAETCVHSILLVNLFRGVRDRDILINVAAAQCEDGLTSLAHVNPKFAEKLADKSAVHALLVSFAHQQLDTILAQGE
jgi:hypothetical protein